MSDLTKLQDRVAALEWFICHEAAIVNEWAKSCPCGTRITDYVRVKLYEWLRLRSLDKSACINKKILAMALKEITKGDL